MCEGRFFFFNVLLVEFEFENFYKTFIKINKPETAKRPITPKR